MISQNALDELGEKEFIKMLRFIDWLWYSDEGQTLALWGVEGETYSVDDDGNIVLNSDIYYNGINPGAEKQLKCRLWIWKWSICIWWFKGVAVL